ncbi:MAG: AbrB/MazE/SpoVT family DNA-binding domain-containing protein [bacterium]
MASTNKLERQPLSKNKKNNPTKCKKTLRVNATTTILGDKGRLVLPIGLRKSLNLKKGATFEVKEVNGQIILIPIDENDQSWYWTEQWQDKVKSALKDVKEGRVSKAYDNLEEALKALKDKV